MSLIEDVLSRPPEPAPSEVSFRWGVVTATAPLRVQLDAPDDAALGITPDSLVPLTVGDRVWCQLYRVSDGEGKQIVVLGKAVLA